MRKEKPRCLPECSSAFWCFSWVGTDASPDPNIPTAFPASLLGELEMEAACRFLVL